MPLLSITRFLFTLLSLAILIGAAYLLRSWYVGHTLTSDTGEVIFVRDDWQLWTGIALLAWSLTGKSLWLRILARPDSGTERSVPSRAQGIVVQGASRHEIYMERLGPSGALPIVLIHGAGMDSTIWSYAKRRLANRFEVIVWDLPGLGRSNAAGDISLDSYAADLRAVLAQVGRRSVVVGHSMGGMIIQTLARNAPEAFRSSVAGAVLVNTTFTNPLRTMILPRFAQTLRPVLEVLMRLQVWLQPLVWMSQWQSYLSGSAHMAMRIGFGPHVTRSQLDHAALLSSRNPPASLARGNLAMFNWDATGAMAAVDVPVLVLAGAIDIVTKEEASRVIAATLQQGMIEVVPDANHMGFLEQHETYNSAIEQFAEAVAQTQAASAPVQ